MKRLLPIVCVILIFIAAAFLMVKIYDKGKDQKPISSADVPQATVDWFDSLIGKGIDIVGKFRPEGIDTSEWARYENIDSMLRIEDDYFVIYYSRKDSAEEHNKALVCQRYAHEAIPQGEQLMKNYPYPNQLNGRKLPIYLANSDKSFQNICLQLNHGTPSSLAIGLYCFRYGSGKVLTDGIIISPKAWTVREKKIRANTLDDDFRQVLWHEMNHFMYFTNWDFSQTSTPCLWFTEGLAEYFAGNYDRLREVGNYSRLDLRDDFRGGGNTEYWAGLSAYLSLEEAFSSAAVSDVVANSYTNSIDKSLKTAIPSYGGLSQWNKEWHQFMDAKEYIKYKENKR